VSASVSFHPADERARLRASSTLSTGAPLTITFIDAAGERAGEATFFTRDQAYTDALVAAINAVPLAQADSA
jgi:hypothetical protein